MGVRTASTRRTSFTRRAPHRMRDEERGVRNSISSPLFAHSSLPLSREVHPHRLDLHVSLERMHAEVAAEPGLLEATERGGGVVHVVRIDPHGARANLARGAQRLLDVARPD